MKNDGNNGTIRGFLLTAGRNPDDDLDNLKVRNRIYTSILKEYCAYLQSNLTNTRAQRKSLINKLFFLLTTSSILAFAAVIIIVLNYENSSQTIIAVGVVLSAEVSNLVLILSKISEYVFNKEETKQIGNIIKNIQDYDKAVRDDIQQYSQTVEPTHKNSE